MIYFDRASNQKGFEVSILLVSPEGAYIPISVKPDFDVTNNIVEYKVCIIELHVPIEIGTKNIRVYGDFNS